MNRNICMLMLACAITSVQLHACHKTAKNSSSNRFMGSINETLAEGQEKIQEIDEALELTRSIKTKFKQDKAAFDDANKRQRLSNIFMKIARHNDYGPWIAGCFAPFWVTPKDQEDILQQLKTFETCLEKKRDAYASTVAIIRQMIE